MDFKHEIIGLKDQGDKNHVDENVSDHGNLQPLFLAIFRIAKYFGNARNGVFWLDFLQNP